MAQVFNVSDAFSSGPYDVDILEENEQDRFEIEDGTYMAPNAPVTPAPPSFLLDGETIILCPNATDDPLDPIPNINSGKNKIWWNQVINFLHTSTESTQKTHWVRLFGASDIVDPFQTCIQTDTS